MTFRRLLAPALLALASTAHAADTEPPLRTPEQILKSVTLPAGYEATVFSSPPQSSYPVAISAAADGTIFMAVDENGSLGAKEKRGKILRLRDTNGDGVADEVKVFAEMDSPRGVIWDGASGTGKGVCYVMHPPNLTAYYDDNGDGVSDRQEDLLTGLGFDLKFRGADHTTNGNRLAIDGFIYIAVGDYGYVEAKAKDGTTIRNRGGGIVRIRPDGTGLEIVSRGQRNIYDVAVSPTLDIFTRDNTNDGGGWNDRLSFVPPGAHMGYPYYFKNFPEDMVPALEDYGGGSPCGALWLDEPGQVGGLYTVEWGRGGVFYHPLESSGAGYKSQQQDWLKLVRPTDMDVDAAGHLYVTSWEGATFNYNGPNVGYVLRLTKKGNTAPPAVDLVKGASDEIVKGLVSKSAVLRLATQRELLRRGSGGGRNEITKLVNATLQAHGLNEPAATVACVQTLLQLQGRGAVPALLSLVAKAPAREFALQALGNLNDGVDAIPTHVLTEGLTDANPRVRSAALTATRRLQRTSAADAVVQLLGDPDPVLAHLAFRTLRELKAIEPCLQALDSSDDKVKPGALKALYGMYAPEVVEGLLARLPASKGEMRRGLLNALCRLANQDEPYTDPHVWWGTRPDTSGPVYKPLKWSESPKIEAALKQEVNAAAPAEASWLIQRMYMTKVTFPGLVELMLSKAGTDTPARLTAIEGLFSSDNMLPSDALGAAQSVALAEKEIPELRARALRIIQKANQLTINSAEAREAAFKAAVAAYAPLVGHDLPHPALTAAVEDFTRTMPKNDNIGALTSLALGDKPAERAFAQTVLVNAATSPVAKGKEKDAAVAAVSKMWQKPENAASLLSVIARVKAKPLAEQVRAHLKDPNNAVAEAALFAYQSLGLSDTPTAAIAGMKYEDLAAAVAKGGDVAQGKDMFLRAGCIACHTVSEAEPPKGPNLAATVKIYDRAALIESILKPNAKIAQGFETQWFKLKKSGDVEGFVTREGGDSLDVRNIVGQTLTLEKGDITSRGKRETSMMPEGLLNPFSPAELASLLAYLESLRGK